MAKISNLEINNQPEGDTSYKKRKFDDTTWMSLGQSVMQTIEITLGNRQALDDFLDYANAMYEMRTEERNDPWEGAANIVVPIVAAEVDEMTSRLTGSAIQPRPFTIRGNDPRATQYAHLVEQFFNSEFDKNNWHEAYETCIHLAARDGTAILEVLWEKSEEERIKMIEAPVLDEQGSPQMDEDGQPVLKRSPHKVTTTKWDAPRFTAVELRDFLLIPAHAPSIEDAEGVARKIYMSERDIWAMVKAGTFDADMAERVLSYTSSNQDELSYDRQGYSTYTISNRINVTTTSVSAPDDIVMSRGPIEIWRMHTRQYDLDGDGIPEENIIWVHDRSRIVIGHAPYEYESGRPFFDLSIMPRPGRFYGFSVSERVRGVQEEADAVHNARLDWQDMAMNPTMYKTNGAKISDENQRVGPGAVWNVNSPTDVGYIMLPDSPQSSASEESLLLQYASRSTGAPQTGGIGAGAPGGGRQSARAAQQAAAVQGMQTNKMITRVRRFMLRSLKFARTLYLRYGMNQMETVSQSQDGYDRLTIPRETIALDYTLNIAGLGGPLDKESRRQDAMLLYQMLMQNPLVAGQMDKIYALTRMALETFDVPEVTSFIGTLEQAQMLGQQQAQQQQQQQQTQLALHLLDHNALKTTGGGSNGPAPAPAQQPGPGEPGKAQ